MHHESFRHREVMTELVKIRELLATLVEQGKPREIPITVKAVERLRDTVPPVRPCGCALCEEARRPPCGCWQCTDADARDETAEVD